MKYYERLQWDKNRPISLKLGFIFALAFVLMAFNYSVPIKHEVYTSDGPIHIETEVTPPITYDIPKPVPPPPAPKIIENIKEIIDQIEFVEEKPVIEDTAPVESTPSPPVDYKAFSDPAPAPKIIVEEKTPDVEKDILFADRMPTFGDCNTLEEEEDRKACTAKHLLSFIHKNVKYPQLARDLGVEGVVVVSFVVDKSGDVRDVKIMRDIGAGCGKEVTRVTNKIDGFFPGKHNGRPVSVVYRIPVKFDLQ